MQTGLVLEGGAMRGIYTAGVLDVLMEHDIRLSGVIGVSAGAIHGCNYVSGQRGRSIRYYRRYAQDPRFLSLRSWLKTGNMVDTDFCYRRIPRELDPFDNDAFRRSPAAFYVVCTDLDTGRAEYVLCDDLWEKIDYLRASASMPLASRTVRIGRRRFLDGGVADSVPLRAFEEMGYRRSVVVLTRPAGYMKGPEDSAVMRLRYARYPAFCQALARRHMVYNETLGYVDRRSREGAAFVIRPRAALPIGRTETDPQRLTLVYRIGRADALRRLPALEAWLAEGERV